VKITLYLMTQKGFQVLKSITENGLATMISSVIVGRDAHLDTDYANEIIALCKKHKIQFHEREAEIVITTKYTMAISWRWLIKSKTTKLIVLHDSLLPKYRGFAPLVNALINKEETIGVSAIFASEQYDEGDIIAQAESKIQYPITIAEAIEKIIENYIELAVYICKVIHSGKELHAIPQNHSEATYSLWRDEDDYEINWKNDATAIVNFINVVSSPYKGASTFMQNGRKIRILAANAVEDVVIENRSCGKVIFMQEQCPIVVCGKGLLKIVEAIDDETNENVLPLKKFRTRFTTKNYN